MLVILRYPTLSYVILRYSTLFYVILRFLHVQNGVVFYVILCIIYILENVVIFGPELRYMDGSKGNLFFF